MPRHGWLALALLASSAPAAEPVTRAMLKPGLAFTAADGADGFAFAKAEPTVALNLAAGEAAHPQSAGGKRFTWAGYINVLQPGAYTFDATVAGKLTVRVGEQVVLSAAAPTAARFTGGTTPLNAGFLPFVATLERTGPTARVELWWQGPGFKSEPVPYYFFGHLPAQRPADFAKASHREHGRLLFEELACAKCHLPTKDDAVAKTLAERAGPNLSAVGGRVTPGWLDAWLADPAKLRPHTGMPAMFGTDPTSVAERRAVAAYLASLGGPFPDTPPKTTGEFRQSVDRGAKLYVTAGCAACHGDKLTAPPTRKESDDGDDPPPPPGEDQFHAAGTAGPGGVYQLNHLGSKTRPAALARYLQNPQATHPHGRMPGLSLTGREAADLAAYLCQQVDDAIPRTLPATPADVAVGKAVFARKGCGSCHSVEKEERYVPAPAPSLAAIRGKSAGCLSATLAVGKVPAYKLADAQRAALVAFVAGGLTGPGSPAPAYQARLALKRHGCLNCHSRDGEGGLDPALVDLMKALSNPDAAEDLTPPRLTGVGHKLLTPWLTKVLAGDGRARPWMGLRMPKYHADVAALAPALAKLEGTEPADAGPKPTLTGEKVEAGRALTGKAGLGCVTCHDIAGVPGGGTRGPDLALTDTRVRRDWFSRWMHQPQRLAPGTKMPANFLNGASPLPTILKGDADAQIEAMWAYYALGPGLPLPAGMDPPKGLAIPVGDRPEVLRTFLPDGAGTKPIAVGYPGGVSLAFDTVGCRLGYAWTGNFLDMEPVWVNRGGRTAKLLGPKFLVPPAVHPWAVTDSRTPPDFLKRLGDPAFGHQLENDAWHPGPKRVGFQGYTLDAGGKPTFRYRLLDPAGQPVLSVADTPAPLPVTVAAGVERTFVVTGSGKTVWYLAGLAAKPPRGVDGETPATTRVVLPQAGDAATVVQATAGVWQAVPAGDGWAVLLRLPEAAGAQTVTVRTWGLPRDDAALVQGLGK